MSRSFQPPDSLSKEDVQRIHDVRRDVWIDGLYGMAFGALSGLLLHAGASFVGRYRRLPMTLNRNTATAWFLGGGAIGSLIMSTTKGKNTVHLLHPIFGRGAKKEPELDGTSTGTVAEEDLKDREKNRLYRRTTLQNALRRKTGGLSDSHGGHWVGTSTGTVAEEDLKDREKNRLYRRTTLQNALRRKTGGLSDSHGGHWVDEKDDQP
ncbi:hypothetical protein ACA910_016906 [Epithemia clementina (nom. ined.)]